MKLSLKLAVYILMLAIISSGIVAVLSYLENKTRVDLRTTNSIESLVSTVSNMASTSAYVNDQALAEEVVSGLQLNDEIRCAEIITNEFRSRPSGLCEGKPALERKLVSPWDSTEVVGQIRIFKSEQYVQALVKEQFINELASLIKVILIVSASILLMTHLIVARPIARVSDQLQSTDFENEVELLPEGERVDEIGSIGRVINLMIANAKKQIISEKMMARKTEELSNHFRLIFQLSKNNLAVTNDNLILQSYNPTFENMVARVQPELKLPNCESWINSVTNEPESLKRTVDQVSEMGKPITTQVKIEFSDGENLIKLYYSLTFVKSRSEEMGVSILFFIYDMTEHQERLKKSEYEANHDNLTTLYNRRAASRKIRHLLSSKMEGESVAIMFIDLDGFKAINDDLGHEAGDEVLSEMGKRLRKVTRKTDVACRWGGDEFLIALDDIGLASATMSANKILKTIMEPIALPDGKACRVGASIGLTLSTDEVSDFQTLLDHADKAMYRVKKSSKNAVMVHQI